MPREEVLAWGSRAPLELLQPAPGLLGEKARLINLQGLSFASDSRMFSRGIAFNYLP